MIYYHQSELVLNRENISFERLDGEVIAISFTSGKYFSAKETASDVFFLIENEVPQSQWTDILSKHYRDFKDSGQIGKFIEALIKEGLVAESQKTKGNFVELPNDQERTIWKAPTLSSFSDLQDLLLIDPIHDASLEGWPNTNND